MRFANAHGKVNTAWAFDDSLEIVISRADVGPGAVSAAARLLSSDERDRATRFARDRDRRRFMIARARLRRLLGERLAVAPEAVEFLFGARGKPRLHPRFGGAADVRFNVSHYEDVLVFAFAAGREVGVDVEGVRAIADADAVAALVFSPREREAYLALDPDQKARGFFNGWTRKEAFVKALGDGLQYSLHRFDVTLAPEEPARLLRVDETSGQACGWTMHSFTPGPGLVGAVVVQSSVGGHRGHKDRYACADA